MNTIQASMPLCQSANSQLLIIDAQERLASVMPADELDLTVTNIKRLVAVAKLFEIPIISSEQYPQGLGPTLAAIREQLPADTVPTAKTCYSSCTAPGFERALTAQPSRKQVVVVGMEAHIGIVQTVAGLARWGYQVFVAADAICSRDPAHRDNALARMRNAGIHVSNTESIAFEWLSDSSHPRFKEFLCLVKSQPAT